MKIHIKRTIIVSVLAGCTAFAMSARAQETATATSSGSIESQSSEGDQKAVTFIKEAAKDNSKEMAMADIAVRKAQNPELKSFAQTLQKEHMQAHQKIQELAQTHKVSLDEAAAERTAKDVNKMEKQAGGEQWDKQFAENALKHHAKDIEKYQKASTELQAMDVKQFAQQTLPKLQQHFAQAQTVARSVGVDQETIAKYAKQVPMAVGGTSDQQSTAQGSGSSSTQTTNSLDHPTQQGAAGQQHQPSQK